MAPPRMAMQQQQLGTRSRPGQLAGRHQKDVPGRTKLLPGPIRPGVPVACGVLRELPMDIRPIRRVVTGHDEQRRAVVVMDGPAANVLHRPGRPGVALTDLWATGTPAALTGGDPVDRPVVLHPPPGGTVFRIIQFDPEHPGALAHADSVTAFAAMGA